MMLASVPSLSASRGRGTSATGLARRLLHWLSALMMVFGLAAADISAMTAYADGTAVEHCESLDPCGDAQEPIPDVEAKAAARHGAPPRAQRARGVAAAPCAPASVLRAPPERPPVPSR